MNDAEVFGNIHQVVAQCRCGFEAIVLFVHDREGTVEVVFGGDEFFLVKIQLCQGVVGFGHLCRITTSTAHRKGEVFDGSRTVIVFQSHVGQGIINAVAVFLIFLVFEHALQLGGGRFSRTFATQPGILGHVQAGIELHFVVHR